MSDEFTSDLEQEALRDTMSVAAVQEGIQAVQQAFAIERQMLNRAIQTLCEITNRTPEEVVAILGEGLDEKYDKVLNTMRASAEVIQSRPPDDGQPKSRLILPR